MKNVKQLLDEIKKEEIEGIEKEAKGVIEQSYYYLQNAKKDLDKAQEYYDKTKKEHDVLLTKTPKEISDESEEG